MCHCPLAHHPTHHGPQVRARRHAAGPRSPLLRTPQPGHAAGGAGWGGAGWPGAGGAARTYIRLSYGRWQREAGRGMSYEGGRWSGGNYECGGGRVKNWLPDAVGAPHVPTLSTHLEPSLLNLSVNTTCPSTAPHTRAYALHAAPQNVYGSACCTTATSRTPASSASSTSYPASSSRYGCWHCAVLAAKPRAARTKYSHVCTGCLLTLAGKLPIRVLTF